MAKEDIIQPPAALRARANQAPVNTAEELQLQFAFWVPVMKGPQDAKYIEDVKLNYLVFYDLLYSQGFRRFDIDEESIFVQIINDRIIKRVKPVIMQDYIISFIDQLPEEIETNGIAFSRNMIKEKVVRSLSGLFNEQRLHTLKPKEPFVFNRDTMHLKFMYFKNGYLQIDKSTITFNDYKKLQGYIWESEIIKRDYQKPKESEEKNYIKRLFFNVSGKDESRYNDLMILAGYASHSFTEYKMKGILFTDSKISDDDESNGRTAKTLLSRIIGGVVSHNPLDTMIKSYVEINGKNFDPKEKHKYSICDLDTKLVVLNDLPKYFDVDTVYNDITEGITVDKKGLQPFRIQAKLIFSSNKVVKIEGASSRDRFIEYELADYYSDTFTPEHEFGMWLFRDFTPEDYSRYYYYMATCSQAFLKNGSKLPQPKEINLKARKLIQTTAREFIEFIEEDLKPIPGERYEKNSLFQQFITNYQDFDNSKFTQRKFSEWLKNYVNYKEGYRAWNKTANEVRTDKKRQFIFIKEEKI